MPGFVRFGDICTGHGGFPPRPNIQASTNVFVNDKGVHRLTDKWAVHCDVSCHDGRMAQGSNSIIVNGLSAAMVGYLIDCGSRAAQGSLNVFGN